ncbi:Crp/Fnr family transcriptional regulator [Endothiovibrio diazotrophicus]
MGERWDETSGRLEPLPLPTRDFFAALTAAEQRGLMVLGRPRAFNKGEQIFRAGDGCTNLYLLMHGKVKIYKLSPTGRELTLWYCFPGEVFGLAEMTGAGRRQVSAQACADTRLIALGHSAFKTFLAANPSVSLRFIEILSRRMRLLSEVLADMVADTVSQRLCKLLLRLAETYGRPEAVGVSLEIVLTHQELADMVGASRQSVSGHMSRLRRLGLLSVRRRRLWLHDPARLHGLSAEAVLPPVPRMTTRR